MLVAFLPDRKFTVKVESSFQLYIDFFFQLYTSVFIQLTKALQCLVILWQIYLINFWVKKTVLRYIADMWSDPFNCKSRYLICLSINIVYICVFHFLQILKWYCVHTAILYCPYGRVYKHFLCALVNICAKWHPFQNYVHFITGKIYFT